MYKTIVYYFPLRMMHVRYRAREWRFPKHRHTHIQITLVANSLCSFIHTFYHFIGTLRKYHSSGLYCGEINCANKRVPTIFVDRKLHVSGRDWGYSIADILVRQVSDRRIHHVSLI